MANAAIKDNVKILRVKDIRSSLVIHYYSVILVFVIFIFLLFLYFIFLYSQLSAGSDCFTVNTEPMPSSLLTLIVAPINWQKF